MMGSVGWHSKLKVSMMRTVEWADTVPLRIWTVQSAVSHLSVGMTRPSSVSRRGCLKMNIRTTNSFGVSCCFSIHFYHPDDQHCTQTCFGGVVMHLGPVKVDLGFNRRGTQQTWNITDRGINSWHEHIWDKAYLLQNRLGL